MSTTPSPAPEQQTRPVRRASRFALTSLASSILAFLVWSWLVFDTQVLDDFDRAMVPPRLGSTALEISRALAVVTLPVVVMLACCLGSWWAYQRRLRNLSLALALAPALAWVVSWAVKLFVARPRPEQWYDPSFTTRGFSYPSSDVAVATAAPGFAKRVGVRFKS